MSDLNEFSINLPMTQVSPMGAAPEAVPYDAPTVDMTASYELPADVSPTDCSHINLSMDAPCVVELDNCSPTTTFEAVVTVYVTDPLTQTQRMYRTIKRFSMDKVKLACEVENNAPCQVIEAITPEVAAKKLAEAQAAQRARVLAGLA